MTHVHYKFSSKRSYNTVVFDGVNITLCELKRLIMTREKLRAADCDLQITNGQTKEEYTDDDCQIPKGSSVIVRRVPSRAGKSSSSAHSSSRSEAFNYNSGFFKPTMDGQKSTGVLPIFSQMADLASAEVSEDYKIKTIMNQSGYDSSNYLKYGAPLPANYTCYRCGSSEHHIRNCPVSMEKNAEAGVRIKKSTGIPRSFMVRVDDPSIQGAMLTNTGDYAVPAIDAEAYAVAKKKIPPQGQQTEDPPDTAIPDELQCLICRDLLNDAVVIPCCGNSYCDDCIRSALLDSEDHICPTCSQSDVSPDTLIANKFLRQAVNNFTREQTCTQSFKSTSRSQDCTPRPSPAPTPPPQSHPEKLQVTDICKVISSDSPPSSSSTSLNIVKVLNETPEKEAVLKKKHSPVESPSVLVSDADICDSQSQPISLVDSVTQAEEDNSRSGSTTQCDQAPHWDRSTSAGVSEGWTAISAHPPPFSSSTFSLPQSPIITPSHIQTYLQQQPLSTYPPGFSTTTPPWTSGPSPQGTPIPAFTSSPAPMIPPLLPKELMLYHRRNRERTPPRGSSYNPSFHRSKSSRSSSRSPSRSRSNNRTRRYSPYSSHRGMSSRSHSSHSYGHSYKRSHSPTMSSSPSSCSQLRSRSPADRHKSRHHGHHHSSSSSRSSRRRKEREASERSYETYLRWKQEYTDWCEKYFNSYFNHFHQMPPPPLLPPPQPHWPSHSSYHHRGRSPPSSDSRSSNSQSYSERSSATTHSSSSHSDSTPTQSFSDSNSPQSDDCSGASHKPGKVDENQNKVKESGKQKTESSNCPKSPPKKTDKYKSKVGEKKAKDLKLSDKGKERKWHEERDEKRHKAKASEKTGCTDADRSRQPGHSKSPDLRSDKSKKRRDEETQRNQRQNIPLESSCDSDVIPKALEREKPKKAIWKPQPLTKENAWEGVVKVKPQKKINININLDGKKNEEDKDDIQEANKTIEVESCTIKNQSYCPVDRNKPEEPFTPDEGIKDVQNDSWEIFPNDETVRGEDSDLWQCALTAMEEEDGKVEEVENSVGVKPQEQEDILNSKRNLERSSMAVDNCLIMGKSGSVAICEEQQKTVGKKLEESMESQSLEKCCDYVKIPCSRQERDGFEKEPHSKVSSHLREVKGKAKRRLVEADDAEEMQADHSARLDGTVAPSSGRDITDSSFDFDRKGKKKAKRESESRKGEEGRRHKERESHSTLHKKSSNNSSQAFTAILDTEKYNSHRESDESRNREGKSRKINVEVDIEWKGKHVYSKHYYHDGHQDPKVHLNWSMLHSQSDGRDRGQLPSKRSTEGNRHGQNWTHTSHRPAPPTAESSRCTALDPREMRVRREEKEQDSKYECNKDKKKQKLHNKEKRHTSPDEVTKSKKRNKDGGHMDFSKEYFSDKYT